MQKKGKQKKSRKFVLPSPTLPTKNQDNLKLLITDKNFQERIKEIREYLRLPESGFFEKEGRENKYQKWEEEMFERGEKMMDDPVFINQLRQYKEMFDNHEISYMKHEELRYALHDPIPVNYLTRQSKILTEDFNVPLSYKECLRHYILFNEIWMVPSTPFSIMKGTPENRHDKCVSLLLYSKVTDKDLVYIKYHINKLFGKDLPDFNPLHDLDTKLAIEEYYRNRNVVNEGDDISYRLTAREIAENIKEDTGKKIEPNDVYEVIKELNKLREKRFRKSLGKGKP
ncbi:hypothetical protein IT397_02765 [Candidatus Nomurabacteria bacterium]|nr:hypothetical protein [Candidatus Nomurabacteria bacterium]